MLRLLGCVNSIMLPDDISEISIIKHRSNLLPRFLPPHVRGLKIRLAHGERDNINIITLARGEIMRRMVKLREAQLNQRLPALVKSPCAARW